MSSKVKNEVLNGGITSEQIAIWKNKYRKISEITVTDGDTQYIGYFRRPDMDTMSAVNKIAKTDEVKGSLILFENCWLGGDATLREDAIVKMAAITQLAAIFQSCTSELKNL